MSVRRCARGGVRMCTESVRRVVNGVHQRLVC